MKKLVFVMVATMALMFVSCNNGPKSNSNESSVVTTDSTLVVEEPVVEGTEISESEASKSEASKPEAVEETSPSKPEEVSK